MSDHLPRIPYNVSVIDEHGRADYLFQRWWDSVAKKLEEQLNTINSQIAALAQQGADFGKEKQEDIPLIVITADYTGVVSPSAQLPYNVVIHRYADTSDVTTSSTWSMAVRSGSISASINSGTGALTVTAIGSDAVIDVTSSRTVNGTPIVLTKPVAFQLKVAQPPIDASSGGGGAGSGGTTQTVTSFSSFNSTSYSTVASFTVKAGSGGRVDLTAPLAVKTAASSPVASYDVQAIWQWDSGGAVWVDLGTAVSSDPDASVQFDGIYMEDDGYIGVSAAKTGLTSGTSYNFRLRFKNTSGSRVMTLSGTATAAGS
jgi:hypothetical protein